MKTIRCLTGWFVLRSHTWTSFLPSSVLVTLFMQCLHPWTDTRSTRLFFSTNDVERRPPDDRKETQTAVVWSCLPFIRSGQNHLARHIERGKKARQTEEEVGRQRQGMDRPGFHQVPDGGGEQEKNGGNWLRNHLWCPNDPRV